MNKDRASTLRDVTDPVRRAARRLVAEASHGTLAYLSPQTGGPLVSRAALSTDGSGDPTILVSTLSRHTGAMAADPRVALLIGEAGAGDALAHARLSLEGTAVPVTQGTAEHVRIRRRFLARRPESEVYVDFADFAFVRIVLTRASLNGGFARAYDLDRSDLCVDVPADLATGEADLVDRINRGHGALLQTIATRDGRSASSGWRVVTLDPRGFEMVAVLGDGCVEIRRLEFDRVIDRASDILPAMSALAAPA